MKKNTNNELDKVLDFSTILASSVHDMKNSIGVLLSSVESILDEFKPATEAQSKHLKTLHYEASRINGELIQLLTLYRKDSDFLPVHIDEQYVVDILEDQVARNQILFETSGVQVNIDCEENLAWYFDGDLVGGVLHNVIVNCIRYTKDALVVSARQEKNMLMITISDNGQGYPSDMLVSPAKRIEEASLSRGSTHLGLYFSEQIAKLHTQDELCGYIELSNNSILGGGEFKLYLP